MSSKELTGQARRRREVWLNITDHTADFLVREGFSIEKATEASEALVKRLIALLGGTNIYFVKDYSFELTQRDEEICDRLERGNADDLAVEYGLSFVRVYQIARQVRARRAAKVKADMAAQTAAANEPRKAPGMYADLQRHLGRYEK